MNRTGIKRDMNKSLFTHAMIFRFPSYLQRRTIMDSPFSWQATIQLLTYLAWTWALYAVYNTHRGCFFGEEWRINNLRTSISTLLRPCGLEVRRNGRTPSLGARLLRWTGPPLYFSLDLWRQLLHYCWIDIFNVEHPCVTARGFSTTAGAASICTLCRHIELFSSVCFRGTPWT